MVTWPRFHWDSIQIYLSNSTNHDLTHHNNATTPRSRSRALIGRYYNFTSKDLRAYENKNSDLPENQWFHRQRSTKGSDCQKLMALWKGNSTGGQPCIVLERNLAQRRHLILCWKTSSYIGLESVTSYYAEGKPRTILENVTSFGAGKCWPHTMLEDVGLALNDTRDSTMKRLSDTTPSPRKKSGCSKLHWLWKRPMKAWGFFSTSTGVVRVMKNMKAQKIKGHRGPNQEVLGYETGTWAY